MNTGLDISRWKGRASAFGQALTQQLKKDESAPAVRGDSFVGPGHAPTAMIEMAPVLLPGQTTAPRAEGAQPLLHAIANSHIDVVWLWRMREGLQEFLATTRAVLDRQKEFPDWPYTASSSLMFRTIQKYAPELFKEVQEAVKAGRWEVVGGMVVEPDCNTPGGESFARQILYGQRELLDMFGKIATAGYNPDSFGHNAMMPAFLKHGGMDSYSGLRPKPEEMSNRLPSRVTRWRADDGSEVDFLHIPREYTVWTDSISEHLELCAKEVEPHLGEGMAYFGHGNHGGFKGRANLIELGSMAADPTKPDIILSTPNRFIESLRAKDVQRPVYEGELQHHAVGCFSAHSGIKKWNREGENALQKAEKFATLAPTVTGVEVPTEELKQGWMNTLINQFHDILAGTSMKEAYDDARNAHGETMSVATRALDHALLSLTWQVDIEREEGMRPVVVFNPHAWPMTTNVEVQVGKLKGDYTLFDDEGREMPMQLTRSPVMSNGRDQVTFTAEIPPMGWKLFKLRPQAPEQVQRPGVIAGKDGSLESERFKLEVDPKTGTLSRLFDKSRGVEVFSGPAAKAVVIDDKSDTWSHEVRSYKDVVGEFGNAKMELVEDGPVRSVLRVESSYGDSKLVQEITMYPDVDQVDVRVKVDWHEQQKVLKLRFPVAVEQPEATAEIPYGTIRRPTDGQEESCQAWVDVSGKSGEGRLGVSILNDGKYSYDVDGSDIGLTVLRSPAYAHHDPKKLTEEEHPEYIDQGVQEFRYSIVPHGGDWREASVPRRAAQLNQAAEAILETYHPGETVREIGAAKAQGDGFLASLAERLEKLTANGAAKPLGSSLSRALNPSASRPEASALPTHGSLASVDAKNVIVSTIKRAEDGDGVIVRAYETDHAAAQARIELPSLGRTLETTFGPSEIKSFKVPDDPKKPVVEVDFIEREQR